MENIEVEEYTYDLIKCGNCGNEWDGFAQCMCNYENDPNENDPHENDPLFNTSKVIYILKVYAEALTDDEQKTAAEMMILMHENGFPAKDSPQSSTILNLLQKIDLKHPDLDHAGFITELIYFLENRNGLII